MEAKTVQPPAIELVTVTVNGKEFKFEKGKNLLAALLENNINVPHYCWHPSLSVAGNCRLCLIEVEGQPRPNISCNMTCTEGLKIKTEGPMVDDCRKGMMEFLLVNHPLDCPVCDRGGECMLQRYSMDYGTGHARTIDERRRFKKPNFDPLIDIERNRCIMCTRCVRYMDEVAGEHLLGVFNRGNRNYIGTFGEGPVSSNLSGNIIDICPVGCLTSKPFRFEARPWELQQIHSTCTLCSSGCPTTTWVRDGVVFRVTPPVRKYNNAYTIDEDTTQFICNEGRFGAYYANATDRLKTPLKSIEGSQVAATWSEAIKITVDALKSAADAGPEKVAILCGGRATNEEYYLLSRIARGVLGTNQIDWRIAFTSPAAAQMAGDALAASDGDLALLDEKHYGATLVVNANLRDSVPIVGLKIKEAARLGRTKLGFIGSRLDHWISDHAKATLVDRPEAIGTAITRLAQSLASNNATPELEGIANLLSGTERGLIVLGLDTAGGALNHEILPAVMSLLQQLGNGWNFLPVAQGRNFKGAFACGAQSDRLPGGDLHSEAERNLCAELWGRVKSAREAGPTAPEILRRAAEGKIQTLLLFRCDELVTHPQRALIEKALANTPNVIAVDVFPSWITKRAKAVLPGAIFYETEGSLAAADGTLNVLTRGNQPPGDAQEDWRILTSICSALGDPAPYDGVGSIFGEWLICMGPPQKFRMEDLRLLPPQTLPQNNKAVIRRKTRPNYKLQFSARPNLPAKPATGSSGKLRLLWTYNIQGEDHLGSRSDEFDELRPANTIELSPDDMKELGLAPGDEVRIEGCRNSARVVLNDSLPKSVAAAGSNVLGLEIAADGAALPEIKIKRVES